MKKIIYIRSTSIINDSRATKEISTYLESNCQVIVLGWNRQNLNNISLSFEDNHALFDMYQQNSEYGSGFKNLFKLLSFQKWLYKKLKKYVNDYDIIHACDFDTAYIASKIAKKYNKKLIYDIYDYYVDCHNLSFLKPLVEKMDINTINNSDCVLICTEQRLEQIKKSKPKYLEVIHNSPSIIEIDKKNNKNFDSAKIKLCYVGILQDDRLLYEIGNLIHKYPKIELHIGGFGKYHDFFEDLSNKLDNVYFYGQMSYEKVLELEENCDILFATYNPEILNHRYSAPNKVYEAMALSKPIIVCNNTGIDNLIKTENLGFVINYNAEEFFECVCKIDEKQYQSIKENGLKVFTFKYSWNVMKDKLKDILNKI